MGRPEDIAALALFLCSEAAGCITGENICADGGMTRLMIYHGEHGWRYERRKGPGVSELCQNGMKTPHTTADAIA